MSTRDFDLGVALRQALTEEPRDQLVREVAEDVGARIRTTPQRRPFLALGRVRLVSPASGGLGRATRLLMVAALVLAAVAAMLLVGRQAPRLPGNGLIVSGSDRAGLFVTDPQTGSTRQLVAAWPANPSGRTNRSDLVAIAPAGDRLAYVVAGVSGWSIPIVELPSGTVLAEVSDRGRDLLPEWGLHWSRDGSRLFIEATVSGLARIVAAEPGTGAISDVGARDAVSRDVATSPVDGRVAFVQTSSAFGEDFRLVIWDPQAGATTELLQATPDGAVVAGAPDWAPDGQSLVVTVGRADGGTAVVRLAADGSDVDAITPWQVGWAEGRWSPDGSRLLVSVSPQGGRRADIYTNSDQRAKLFVVAPSGDGWRELVDRACANAAWSPDGSSVLYERGSCEDPPTAPELRVVAADGSADRLIRAAEGADTSRLSIAWQPIPVPR